MKQTEMVALELGMMGAWPAAHTVWHEGWAVRWTEGFTKRANSVTAVYTQDVDFAAQVAWCETFYRQQGLPIIFRTTPLAAGPQLAVYGAAAGYERLDETVVQVRGMGRIGGELGRVRVEDWQARPMAWVSLAARLRQDGAAADQPMTASFVREATVHAALLARIGGEKLLAVGYDEAGVPVAMGIGVRFAEMVAIFGIVTAVGRRREGWGRGLTMALMDWGQARGAKQACLQVAAANQAARQLYTDLGFEEVYRYAYWRKVNSGK